MKEMRSADLSGPLKGLLYVAGPYRAYSSLRLSRRLDSDSGNLLAPDLTLFNALAVVSLFGVIGKLAEQFTGEAVTRSTVRLALALALTAGFHRAAIAPKRPPDQ